MQDAEWTGGARADHWNVGAAHGCCRLVWLMSRRSPLRTAMGRSRDLERIILTAWSGSALLPARFARGGRRFADCAFPGRTDVPRIPLRTPRRGGARTALFLRGARFFRRCAAFFFRAGGATRFCAGAPLRRAPFEGQLGDARLVEATQAERSHLRVLFV